VVDNNNANKKFEVKGPYVPPKKNGNGGPIPGEWAVTALVAITLLATVVARRRRA
jgi:hypothetical protein